MHLWTREQAMQLLDLIQQRGFSESQLATIMSLSMSQVGELLAVTQQSSASHFYTETIKYHTGMRAIRRLQEMKTHHG